MKSLKGWNNEWMRQAMSPSSITPLFIAAFPFWASKEDAFQRTCCVFRPVITAKEFEEQEHRDHEKTSHPKTDNALVE